MPNMLKRSPYVNLVRPGEEDERAAEGSGHSLPNIFSSAANTAMLSSEVRGGIVESNRQTSIPLGNEESLNGRYTLGATAFPSNPIQSKETLSQYYAELFEELEASSSEDTEEGGEDSSRSRLWLADSGSNLQEGMDKSGYWTVNRKLDRKQITSIKEGDDESGRFSFSVISWSSAESAAGVEVRSASPQIIENTETPVLFDLFPKEEGQQTIEKQDTFDTEYPILSHSTSEGTSTGYKRVSRTHANSSRWKLKCCLVVSALATLGIGLFVGLTSNNPQEGEGNVISNKTATDTATGATEPSIINPPTLGPTFSTNISDVKLTFSPSSAPSDVPVFMLFQNDDLFPSTWKAIEDPSSPQARSYDFLLNDPMMKSYSTYRKLQRFVLAILFYETRGEHWKQSDYWLSIDSHECDWVAVNCGSFQEISELKLSNNGLNGTLPEELGLLLNLRHLDVSYNNLAGRIPTSIVNFNNMQTLRLGWNELTGSVTTEIGNLTTLEELSLSFNHLSGTIPGELGFLKSLKRVALSDNFFSGSIPHSISRLSNLVEIELQENLLSSVLPMQLWELSNLSALCLYQNALSGTLPSQIALVSHLIELELDANQFEGSVPTELGMLTGLKRFWLSSNRFTGQIPEEIAHLSLLEGLYLQVNRFTGTLPTLIGSMTKLTELKLFENQIGGTLASELGNLASLEFLSLGWNLLSGTITSELGRLTQLVELDLVSNELQGTIPSSLGRLTQLEHLWLFSNNVVGTIPTQLGQLTQLKQLLLFWNWLEGSLPTELSTIKSLLTLSLEANRLSGSIPSQLGLMTGLQWLMLYDNVLSGSIPSEIGNLKELHWLRLEKNSLSGPIPDQLVALTNLDHFALQETFVTGFLPAGFCDFIETNLLQVSLDCNQVTCDCGCRCFEDLL